MNHSDESLISEFQNHGTLEAVEQLLFRYKGQVYGFLLTMLKESHDAEDALQETFFSAIRGLHSYREQKQFKSWLFRIARNEAVTIIRRRVKLSVQEFPHQATGAQQPESESPLPYEKMEKKEQLSAFRAALDQLPEVEKEVVSLRIRAELPFKEIAEMTGCSMNTVLGRMHNAKKRLKKIMMEEQPA